MFIVVTSLPKERFVLVACERYFSYRHTEKSL
jgi:hypothetical protein